MQQILNWLDDYTDGIQIFVHNHLVLAPLLLLLLEESGIPLPVPGDAIIAYVGYGLHKSNSVTVWQALIVALIAVLIGATILFFMARRWGQTLIQKLGRFIFLKPAHLERAENLFARFGIWAIIFGRHIPGLRIPITIFAAISGVRYRTFIVSTFMSTVGWVLLYLEIGSHFGGDFQALFQRDTGITVAVCVGLVLLFVGLHVYGSISEKRATTSK